MNDYQVELISEGSITQIPDSQKVFGALVYLFAEKYGSEKATTLTKAILNKEIHFSLSNVMPYGYLPTPQDFLIEKLYKDSKPNTETKTKEQYSLIKERNYITDESLKKAISTSFCNAEIYPYISVDVRQQLRASIDSVRYNIPELESNLYSVPTIVLSEIKKLNDGSISSSPVKKFCIYLQTDESELGKLLLEMLNQAANDKRSIILGKRASQGMNLFRINKIVKQERVIQEHGIYLNLGMLLPDNINFEASTIKLFTSERRPFEILGGWEQNLKKQFISFIAEGSMIAACSINNAGKSIESPFNKARDIVFGNAYLYPLSIAERTVSYGEN